MTYNSGATTNDPGVYIDGASVTVTELFTPAGTLTASDNGGYTFGNRADGLRHINGRLAELAIWHGTILSAGNAASLYNSGAGARADSIGVTPTFYMKTCGTVSPEPNEIGGASTGTVTGALFQPHPFANCEAPASSSSSCGGSFVLLGIQGGC